MQAINQQIGEVWDRKAKAYAAPGNSWWHYEQVREHIGRKINGSFANFIRTQTEGRKFERGVSVGCGSGRKEMSLIQAGIVGHFDLYELSAERIETGRRKAEAIGLQDRVTFHLVDAFAARTAPEQFDLVHWDNSLHHMLDVPQAIKWSRHVLKPGGAFVMDDFVGPSRFQWSEQNLDLVESFRALLPERLLRRPNGDGMIAVRPTRKTIKKMIELDPSEAADSDRIMPSLAALFPAAAIVPTGGAIYHLGLGSGIYQNLDLSAEEDRRILDFALLTDDLAIKLGETHYAACVAIK